MLRAAVSAEDMGQRALAAGLLLCMCVLYCYRSDFVFHKKKRMLRTAVSASARSPQVYYYICVSSTAIEEVFFFCSFFCKAYIFVCSALLLLYVCVLMLLCAARGGVGGGSLQPRVLKALLRLFQRTRGSRAVCSQGFVKAFVRFSGTACRALKEP
jgi:hypothetical protein